MMPSGILSAMSASVSLLLLLLGGLWGTFGRGWLGTKDSAPLGCVGGVVAVMTTDDLERLSAFVTPRLGLDFAGFAFSLRLLFLMMM